MPPMSREWLTMTANTKASIATIGFMVIRVMAVKSEKATAACPLGMPP